MHLFSLIRGPRFFLTVVSLLCATSLASAQNKNEVQVEVSPGAPFQLKVPAKFQKVPAKNPATLRFEVTLYPIRILNGYTRGERIVDGKNIKLSIKDSNPSAKLPLPSGQLGSAWCTYAQRIEGIKETDINNEGNKKDFCPDHSSNPFPEEFPNGKYKPILFSNGVKDYKRVLSNELIDLMNQSVTDSPATNQLFMKSENDEGARIVFADSARNRRAVARAVPPFSTMRDFIQGFGDLPDIKIVPTTGQPVEGNLENAEKWGLWSLDIYNVTKASGTGKGLTTRMAELTCKLTIEISVDPTQTERTKFFTTAGTSPDFANVENPAASASNAPAPGDNADSNASDSAPSDAADMAQKAAAAMTAGSKTGDTTKDAGDTAPTNPFAAFLPPGLDVTKLAGKPGFELLGGFAVPDRGPQAMIGVAGYLNPKFPIGLLFGLTTTSPNIYGIGLTYKVGNYLRPYVEFGFSSSQNSNRSQFLIGAAINLNDLFAGTPKTNASSPANLTVTVKQGSVGFGPDSYSESQTMAVAYLSQDLDLPDIGWVQFKNGKKVITTFIYYKPKNKPYIQKQVYTIPVGTPITSIELYKDYPWKAGAMPVETKFDVELDGTKIDLSNGFNVQAGKGHKIILKMKPEANGH